MPRSFISRSPRLPPVSVLLVGVFAAGVDTFVAVPMLLAIGEDLGHSLASVAAVVAGYTFAYGLMQLGWVYLSDRHGRITLIRIGLAGAVIATVAAVLVPGLAGLIVARVFAGAAFATVAPATITFIGDHVPVDRRARTLGDQVAAYAAGTAVGIVWGGLASDFWSWRWGFAGSAVVAAVALAVQLRYWRDGVDEPRSFTAFTLSVRKTIGNTWPRAVAILALFEGAVLIGFLAFFPAAIEEGGGSRRLAAGWPDQFTMALGLLLGAAGLTVAAASRSIGGMAAAALLVATGFALVHPLLQTWATAVSPRYRATMVGLFAMSLFVGAALTTQLAAPLLTEMGFGWTFAIGAALAAVLAGAMATAWTRYERAEAGDSASVAR